MSKVSNVKIIEMWGYDELFPILKDAFKVLYISYSTVYQSRQNNHYTKPENAKNRSFEDRITDDLIEDEYNFEKEYDYSFIPQYKNIKYRTRIDIAVYYRVSFGKYYKIEIECKLLKIDNIDYIIKGGINKFKSNKYSDLLPIAGMLLYNTQKDIESNITSLNNKITSKISPDEILQHYPFIDNYKYTYKSIHKRLNNTNLELYNCVFNYSELIDYS